PLQISSVMVSARAVRTGQTVHAEDINADPELAEAAARFAKNATPPRTRLAVPIVTGTGVFGAVTVVHTDVRPFTPRQVGLIETFARQAGIAIENVRLFNETKEALAQQT